MPLLSLIISFRNRDMARVQRCLHSLAAQTFTDFELLFVDYGSDATLAQSVGAFVEQFDFCRYIYAEARGYSWNRAKALNIGIRRAQGEYIITTDIDMIFTEHFLQMVADAAMPNRLLHSQWRFLPQGFDDWDNLTNHADSLRLSLKEYGHGGFIGAPATIQKELRGFDELYRYYGQEDTDMTARLKASGLEPYWISHPTEGLYHQWHPTSTNDLGTTLLPPAQRDNDYWNMVRLHTFIYASQMAKTLVRNDDSWGHLPTSDNRPLVEYINLETGVIQPSANMTPFKAYPYNRRAARDFLETFNGLNDGEVLAVSSANAPQRLGFVSWALHNANRVLRTLGIDTYLDYRDNTLQQFVNYFIMLDAGTTVADYYLDTHDHHTLLVKRTPVATGINDIAQSTVGAER